MSELLVGGDWACAEGDTATMAHVASQLASCLAEPLRAQMLGFCATCRNDPAHAGDEWSRVREMARAALRRPEVDSSPH